MRSLSIVRHSKAESYAVGQTDFQRALTEKGKWKAEYVARQVAQEEWRPDFYLSSPATRALETAQIFARVLGADPSKVQIEPDLYTFGNHGQVLDKIRELDDRIYHPILFGHNPTFTTLAWHLSSHFRHEMSTSAVVTLELPIEHWTELGSDEGRVLLYYTRKIIDHLREGD